MLDERSLVVTYKDWRGEPRSHGLKRSDHAPPSGDCIDCQACVQVCPAGIDIRDGNQYECITCALCIDACDEMMAKVGRPRGLIDYATLEDCRAEAAGAPPVPVIRTILRPRTIAYFSAWGAVGLAMMFALSARTRLDLAVGHDRNPLYVQLSDRTIRNAYTIRLRNMESRPRKVHLAINGLPGATMWDSLADDKTATPTIDVTLAPDQVDIHRIYVRARADGEEAAPFTFVLTAIDDEKAIARDEARFDRPEK
jgi:cytochrome c oxidase accessory protein FixG